MVILWTIFFLHTHTSTISQHNLLNNPKRTNFVWTKERFIWCGNGSNFLKIFDNLLLFFFICWFPVFSKGHQNISSSSFKNWLKDNSNLFLFPYNGALINFQPLTQLWAFFFFGLNWNIKKLFYCHRVRKNPFKIISDESRNKLSRFSFQITVAKSLFYEEIRFTVYLLSTAFQF